MSVFSHARSDAELKTVSVCDPGAFPEFQRHRAAFEQKELRPTARASRDHFKGIEPTGQSGFKRKCEVGDNYANPSTKESSEIMAYGGRAKGSEEVLMNLRI